MSDDVREAMEQLAEHLFGLAADLRSCLDVGGEEQARMLSAMAVAYERAARWINEGIGNEKFSAYAQVPSPENSGGVTVRDSTGGYKGGTRHKFPFSNTQRDPETGLWKAPRDWGDGPSDERLADFDADLAELGFRRVGEWVSDPDNRWASGWQATVEKLA